MFSYWSWIKADKPNQNEVSFQEGCVQVATTTPCNSVDKRLPQVPSIAFNTDDLSTYSFGNFSFSYPPDALIKKLHSADIILIYSDNVTPHARVVVSLGPRSLLSSFNPTARTLKDYEKGYPVGDYFDLISFTRNGLVTE